MTRADFVRITLSRRADEERRSELGQFLTPSGIARFMAGMFTLQAPAVRLLDAGAGVGSLTAAAVAQLASRPNGERPSRIDAAAYELDETIASDLSRTLADCAAVCAAAGIQFSSDLQVGDFVKLAAEQLEGGLFARPARRFNAAILNPPYRKINSDSDHRLALRAVGVETSNLYAAFLALVVKLLDDGGELVAITPRSFCNGPYFRPFRQLFLDAMALRRIHVFDSRSDAFSDDEVLQENVIIHAVKGAAQGPVVVTANGAPGDEWTLRREVPFEEVVQPGDQERFIHIVPDVVGAQVAARLSACRHALPEIDVEVSTGRVVDFRAKEHLRPEPDHKTVPLIYPAHFAAGRVEWPNAKTRKPNAIVRSESTESLLVPRADYVLVKRFSSKEERRRVVAAVYEKADHTAPVVGFENHLNVFHRKGGGLPLHLARGLAAFLNSTLVDLLFRQFNGHTQVNATDLRSMRYPSAAKLEALGRKIGEAALDQEAVDAMVEQELIEMSTKAGTDPVAVKRKIEQALGILKALGLPREQLNERSALTLLASLNLAPRATWAKCDAPRIGITPMMEFIAREYGKTYAPNTRETVRRQTVHQFVQAGLLVENPDEPTRPINSPKWCYQVAPAALALLRAFGTTAWDQHLAGYLASVQTLKDKYAREREMTRIPVTLPEGGEVKLSAGGQNALVKEIIEKFCANFTPKGHVVYVGDADEKYAIFDEKRLSGLGVTVPDRGKMPDVIVHHAAKNWLVLVEAVTSHGPMNGKRRAELEQLFKGCSAGIVYVTAFMDRRAMNKYLGEISWETEVWVADAPTHMIHFNGERFLGPY